MPKRESSSKVEDTFSESQDSDNNDESRKILKLDYNMPKPGSHAKVCIFI